MWSWLLAGLVFACWPPTEASGSPKPEYKVFGGLPKPKPGFYLNRQFREKFAGPEPPTSGAVETESGVLRLHEPRKPLSGFYLNRQFRERNEIREEKGKEEEERRREIVDAKGKYWTVREIPEPGTLDGQFGRLRRVFQEEEDGVEVFLLQKGPGMPLPPPLPLLLSKVEEPEASGRKASSSRPQQQEEEEEEEKEAVEASGASRREGEGEEIPREQQGQQRREREEEGRVREEQRKKEREERQRLREQRRREREERQRLREQQRRRERDERRRIREEQQQQRRKESQTQQQRRLGTPEQQQQEEEQRRHREQQRREREERQRTRAPETLAEEEQEFDCRGRPYGYYPDIATGCQGYHICNPVRMGGTNMRYQKHSFQCNPGTKWDQQSMACVAAAVSISCQLDDSFDRLSS